MNSAELEALLRDDSQANDSEFLTTVWEPKDSILELVERIERKGGTRCKVKLETARSPAAQVYAEGDGLPAALVATTRDGYLDWIDIRCVIEETGHAMRAAGAQNEGFEIEDPDYLLRIANAQIAAAMAEQYQAQLEYQVSSTNAYPQAAQLSRVTNPSLVSWEVDASGGAIDADLLTDLVVGGRGSPNGCRPELVTVSDGQFAVALKLATDQIAHNLAPGGQSAVMLTAAGLYVSGVPVIPVDYQTDTIAFGWTGISTRRIRVVPHSLGAGGYDVLNLGPGEQDRPLRLQISASGAIYAVNSHEQGRLYDLAAS